MCENQHNVENESAIFSIEPFSMGQECHTQQEKHVKSVERKFTTTTVTVASTKTTTTTIKRRKITHILCKYIDFIWKKKCACKIHTTQTQPQE